jgi:hydroxymethylbilane synthase
VVASHDGQEQVRGQAEGSTAEAERIGRQLGSDLMARGARQILDEVYGS